MGELVRFPRHDDEDSPKAKRPSAPVVVIPTIDLTGLRGANVEKAARIFADHIIAKNFTLASAFWRDHVADIKQRTRKIYSDAAVERMLAGYHAAVKARVEDHRAVARGEGE